MKTGVSLILILVFSFLIIPKNIPRSYPPKPVLEQRRDIKLKEQEIETIICEIEATIQKDSAVIYSLKQQVKNGK